MSASTAQHTARAGHQRQQATACSQGRQHKGMCCCVQVHGEIPTAPNDISNRGIWMRCHGPRSSSWRSDACAPGSSLTAHPA